MLPGIGSYIALAIDHKDLMAITYAIIAMLVVILLYDQVLSAVDCLVVNPFNRHAR